MKILYRIFTVRAKSKKYYVRVPVAEVVSFKQLFSDLTGRWPRRMYTIRNDIGVTDECEILEIKVDEEQLLVLKLKTNYRYG